MSKRQDVAPLLGTVNGQQRRVLEGVDSWDDDTTRVPSPVRRPASRGATKLEDIPVDAPPLSSSDEDDSGFDGSNEVSSRGDIGRTKFGATRTPAARSGRRGILPLELESATDEDGNPGSKPSRNRNGKTTAKRKPEPRSEEKNSSLRKKAKPSEAKALENFGDHLTDDPFERNQNNQKPRIGYGAKDRRQVHQKAVNFKGTTHY